MPTILTPADIPPRPETAPNRIRWTRQQCDAIRDAGILTDHYELIDGEIISKMGQKPPHSYVITALLTWLTRLFGADCLRIQSTLRITDPEGNYNEPEPDVAVTIQPYTAYSARHPGPADLLLLIEVSDTTLRFDLTTKAALYAGAGIRDYWVVDVIGRRILVHRNPTDAGYQNITAFTENETVATLAHPNTTICVSDLLPPAEP
jgi:Uma2 family endonuclease